MSGCLVSRGAGWWQDPIFRAVGAPLECVVNGAERYCSGRGYVRSAPNCRLSERGRTAIDLAASLVVLQCVLGVITVLFAAPPLLAVVHLLVAMLLWSALILALFDASCEPAAARSSLFNQQATDVTSTDAAATLAPAAAVVTSYHHAQQSDGEENATIDP